MIREAIKEARLYNVEKNRAKLVPANEFVVFVEGDEKFHFKGGKGKFWRKSELYANNNWDDPEWTRFEKSYDTAGWNPAMIVDLLIEHGWEVTDVVII